MHTINQTGHCHSAACLYDCEIFELFSFLGKKQRLVVVGRLHVNVHFRNKIKYTCICIAHRRGHASNALPLPVRRPWSPQISLSASHQRNLQDHGYGLSCDMHVYFPSYRWILIPAYPQRANSGWVDLGACSSEPRWCSVPVQRGKDGHPSRH